MFRVDLGIRNSLVLSFDGVDLLSLVKSYTVSMSRTMTASLVLFLSTPDSLLVTVIRFGLTLFAGDVLWLLCRLLMLDRLIPLLLNPMYYSLWDFRSLVWGVGYYVGDQILGRPPTVLLSKVLVLFLS